MQTSTICFDFSLGHYFDGRSNAINKLRRSLWINLETVDCGAGGSSAARQEIHVDIDAMQPGSAIVLPVGAALTQKKLIFKRHTKFLAVSFCFANRE